MEENIARAIIEGVSESRLKRIARENGMKTMLDDCLMKLDMTTLSEIIRIIPHEMIKDYKLHQIAQLGKSPDEPVYPPPVSPETSREAKVEKAQKTTIFDPNVQQAAIEKMFQFYESHREKQGQHADWSGAPLFVDFIGEHYRRICREHHCDRVSFFIEVTDKDVGIRSVPMVTPAFPIAHKRG